MRTTQADIFRPDRRQLLAGVAFAAAANVIPARAAPDAIRPFRVNVPEADLADLRRRIRETRWPDQETVSDNAQGVPLKPLQEIAHYWGTDYDWRKVEAR